MCVDNERCSSSVPSSAFEKVEAGGGEAEAEKIGDFLVLRHSFEVLLLQVLQHLKNQEFLDYLILRNLQQWQLLTLTG